MQRDDGRGVSMRDLTHLFVAGGARRPEQERGGVQAVDAGLNVADVPPSSAWLTSGTSFSAGLYIAARLRASARASSFALLSS